MMEHYDKIVGKAYTTAGVRLQAAQDAPGIVIAACWV